MGDINKKHCPLFCYDIFISVRLICSGNLATMISTAQHSLAGKPIGRDGFGLMRKSNHVFLFTT